MIVVDDTVKMTYQEILKSVGYPTDVLIIDFETFFSTDYSLSKMSTIEYIQDPRFDFTGMGYGWDNQIHFIPKPDLYRCMKGLQQYYGENLEQVTIIAKNCKFDMTILAVKFGIIPPYIIDIDDLLRHYDARMSHKMRDVAPMFGLQSKGDTMQFKGLHYEEMDASVRKNLADYGIGDIDIEVDLFKILLPLLTNPTMEIPIARHTLDLYLKPSFECDFQTAGILKIQMLVELQELVDKTGCTNKQLSSPLKFTKILQDALPEGEVIPVKQGKPGKNMIKLLGPGVIPAFAKDDVPFQELLVHPDQTIQNLCKARQAVKSWPLHIKRINNIMNQAAASGGKIMVPLNYYGAHTGRWSGGEGINLQNLGGRGRAGSGVHPLIRKMRSLLRAPEGFTLGISDSAQIEARVLAWLANQDDLMKGFADGEDIYSVFATELFKVPVHKPKGDESDADKRLLKIRRGFGKDAILGCGYGMGTNKFFSRCVSNEDLRPYFDSGEYDWDFINHLIKTYRSKYSYIPKFWKECESAFKWVIKYPHEQTTVSKKYDKNGNAAGFRLSFFNKKGTVHIVLPSGRHLTYRHCRLAIGGGYTTIQWHYGHLWGGSIVENIVQAASRDLLAYWILEMEQANLNVIFSNHDEIICMIKKDRPDEPPPTSVNMDLDGMLSIMRTGPDWAEGLPLDAEAELSDVYKK